MRGGGTGKWVKEEAEVRVAEEGVRTNEEPGAELEGGGKRMFRRAAPCSCCRRSSSCSSFTDTTALTNKLELKVIFKKSEWN